MQRDLFLRFLFFLAVNIFPFSIFGQDQTDQNWYFGNGSNGIQFSRPGDTARLVNRPVVGIAGYGNAGGAVASDPSSGGLLFYTDGSVVYDATHRAMPNGSGLNGNPTGNQPAVICLVPGSTNRYYIITNTATSTTPGQVKFTEVDMTLLGNNTVNANIPAPPLGDVGAVKALDVVNLNTESEGMIIIPHVNKTDFWLITHEAGTDAFTVSAITAAGITAPATATSSGSAIPFNAAHFAYHAASGKLAVAPEEANKNVAIYNFNNTTGALTFNNLVLNSAVTASLTQPVIYDVEFSNAGDFLYVSHQGDVGVPGSLLQFDLLNPSTSSASVLPQSIFKSYGIQIAPDSSVYHLYQAVANGPFLVGRITDPDTVAVAANYEPIPFGAVNFNATQFPGFLARTILPITLDFTVSGTCANAPSTFFPVVVPGADSLRWNFGDQSFSNTWSPTHTYQQGQAYSVRLTAFINGDSSFITKPVDITQFDVQVNLVQDTTACSCELKFPNALPAPTPCNPFTLTATPSGQTGAIQWYGPSGLLPGQTSLSLTAVDSAGFYYVLVQDPNGSGCAAYAGVNIKEYGVDDPRSNIWYFGNNGGINFNADFRPATGADAIEGDVISAEGVAVICDRNGQILLSTNGEQVFDRDGNPAPLLPLPPGLGGNQNATQSALIIPVAGDPTLYYIFVTQEVYPQTTPGYELRYAIFDLKKGTNGELVDPDNDLSNGVSTVLFTKNTERITGNENWLIAHEYGNNNFRAYQITPQGLSGPVISSIGSDHSLAVAENARGYMKLSPNNLLAVALSTPGVSNAVEIFDFDNATGAVTNYRSVDLQQPAGQVYGLEFSPSGTKMYASTIGAGSSLHEFAYDSTISSYIKKPLIPVIAAPQEIGALERGPDGTIYVATNGASTLGTINANENVANPSTFNPTGFALFGGTSSTLGLPNFIQNIADPIQAPSISVTGLCFGSPTDFAGSGTDVIDTLTWFFGDGQSQKGANLTSLQHTYSAPGTYIVTLRLSNRCVGFVANLTDTVTISPIPVALSGAITLCTGSEAIAATPANNPDLANLTFLWSTGETTRTIIPPAQAIYTVTVTSTAGCSATGDYLVADNRPQVELGPDQNLCENVGSFVLDAQNPGSTYAWTLNGAAASSAQTITVATTNPGTFKYVVTVNDPFTTCTVKDSVTYTFNEQPVFTSTPTNPTACNVADGRIDIQITSAGTFTYSVSGRSGIFTGSDQTGPSPVIPVPNLLAGGYNITVANQVSGCQNRRTVGLSDNAFTVAIARAATCNDVNNQMGIIITTTAAQPAFSYRILSGTTTTVATQGDQSNANPTAAINNASYVAEVTTPSGCLAISPVTAIRQDAPVPIDDVNINECSNPISIEVISSASPTYSWTGPGVSPSPATTSVIMPTANVGQNDYRLRLTAVGFCPKDTIITVNFEATPLATITQSDACQDVVTLSATPVGNYVYRWTRGAVQIPGGQQIQVTPADNGINYTVEARNTINACVVTKSEIIDALGLLTVDISNPQPCEGTDFTLDATVNQTPDVFKWTLNNNLISGATTNVLAVTDDVEGLYKITVEKSTTGVSCVAKDSVQVTIAPVTAGLLVDTGIICPDPANTDTNTNSIVLNPGSDFISYTWFKDGVAITGETGPTYTATETGLFSVDLINPYNCPSSDKITLREECDPLISGPNAFRPDGLNAEFYLFTFFIADTNFEIFIFNRWGEMIYYSPERDFRWNGNNKSGQPVPLGTYTYLVKYKSSYRPQDGIQEHRGGVLLLR